MGITELLVEYCTHIISITGHAGIIILMTLESMIAPAPSEAVMPFAGFLVYEGQFTLWGITLTSTIGSIIGSGLSYYMGAYLGAPFIHRFGKYLLLDEHHLELTEKFFQKYGEKAVFISRFVPVIRHFISIPAGIGKMHKGKFFVYTAVGAGLWNLFLGYVGYRLGENWDTVSTYFHITDIIVIAGIIIAVLWFVYSQYKKRYKKS